jgi:L-threonylcarbamoyladenylate synthase
MPPRHTRVVVVDRDRPDPDVMADAAVLIRGGGLVVFPTETVYGLGAHALDAHAVAAIFEAKGRPATDPLIVHVANVADLAPLVREMPAAATALASRFWPGPLTLILPKSDRVPPEVTAGLDTVAVRVPAHPVARALLEAAGVPIAAPSANLFSRPSPTRAAHVLADLDGRVDLVLDAGSTDVGVESTVLDLTVSPPLVRRPGGVSLEELQARLPGVQLVTRLGSDADAQVSPGQLLRHYAPRARMTLVEGPADAACHLTAVETRTRVSRGITVGILAADDDVAVLERALASESGGGRIRFRAYGARGDLARAARELFDAIRTLDSTEVDEILAIAPDVTGIGVAIHDRLMRAAEGRVKHAARIELQREA